MGTKINIEDPSWKRNAPELNEDEDQDESCEPDYEAIIEERAEAKAEAFYSRHDL